LGTSHSYGQTQEEFICTFDPIDPNDPGGSLPPHNSGSIDPALLATFTPKLFNIYYIQVNDADGNFGQDAQDGDAAFIDSKEKALASVALLNQTFNEYNIFFKFRGVDQLDSPQTLDNFNGCPSGTEANFLNFGFTSLANCLTVKLKFHAEDEGIYDVNAINVFMPGNFEFGGKAESENVIMARENVNKGAFVHEVGHVLGLKHTDSNYYTGTNSPYPGVECEHVTRIPADPNFNAIPLNLTEQGKGDQILDTNAVPNFNREWCWNNAINPGLSNALCSSEISPNNPFGGGDVNYNIQNCSYTGTGVDCEGTDYEILDTDVQNFMAYTVPACRNQFTVGQAIHMQEDIEHYTTRYDDILAPDFSSLYEPYEGSYYLAGPLDPATHTPLFQPGFDYQFVECVGPYSVPAPFGESFTVNSTVQLNAISAYETDYSIITHPNHTAINIIQVNQAFGETLYEKCYNNFNLNPKGGRVVRFNDGVFNYNTTTTEKDSTSINTTTLIQDLTPGLYKVEKDYDGGATTQTIIQKNNE
jgi:hypothetical protein